MAEEFDDTQQEEPKKGSRKWIPNNKTRIEKQYVAFEDLDPPPPHEKGTEWTEEQAIDELELLIRFYGSRDLTKNHPAQCLFMRGYRAPQLYDKLAKKFPETCGPLYEFANELRAAKVSNGGLTKELDSRMAIFAMTNISKWRQNAQLDVATNVSIKARDYKGIQPIINKRMADKKKA